MESIAVAKYKKISISPRKARLVVDLIRNMGLQDAINTLQHLPNKAAPYVIKVLQSALGNLEYKQSGKKILTKNIYIESIYVNQGKVLKRIQPAPQGRAHPIRKPTAHITVTLATMPDQSLVENAKSPKLETRSTSKQVKVDKKVTALEKQKALLSVQGAAEKIKEISTKNKVSPSTKKNDQSLKTASKLEVKEKRHQKSNFDQSKSEVADLAKENSVQPDNKSKENSNNKK